MPLATPPPESVLVEAHGLVHGDRGERYDHPAIDYERVATIANATLGRDLSPEECVVILMAVKLSRLGGGMQRGDAPAKFRDSVVDLTGYAECLWSVLTYEP